MSDQHEHENRSLGGYKAALHNPNVSEQAKEHAAEVLKSHGAELTKDDAGHLHGHAHGHGDVHTHDQHRKLPPPHDHSRGQEHNHQHSHTHETRHATDDAAAAKHEQHVIGGLKATLSNPRTSVEAKDHAVEKLKEHGEKI